MNKMIYLSGMLLGLFLGASCNRDRNTTTWDYFPDMFYSTAYETYSENPNFADSMTMRHPAPGSVPVGFAPFNYAAGIEERARAGNELSNPLKGTEEDLKRGMEQFTIFCAVCHGNEGQGDGQIFRLGLYPMKPRPLAGAAANVLKDGEIYHTITLGFGSMGAYGSQVRPEDRWRIVLHIRELGRNSDAAPK